MTEKKEKLISALLLELHFVSVNLLYFGSPCGIISAVIFTPTASELKNKYAKNLEA